MSTDVVDKVVAILEEDAIRRGGSVTYDRLLSLCRKYKLEPTDISTVKRRLIEREVGIQRPEDETSPESDDEDIEGHRETADPDEPTEREPPDAVRDIVRAYYRNASQLRKRLTPLEELALAHRIQAGRAASERRPTAALHEVEALEELIVDGKHARDQLTEANLLLVPFVAKDFEGRSGVSLEDLIQEGNLGLMRAVDRFEGGHDARFATYAVWWIWAFMKRAVADRGRLVRLPVHLADRIPQLLRTRRALLRENGTAPTIAELATHLRWHIEHVLFVLQALDDPVSIDAPVGDGKRTFSAWLAAPPEVQPDVATNQQQERRILGDLVQSLGKKMAYVLAERFGLGGRSPKTLEEIGRGMGVSRERIRQIEAKALDKLRRPAMKSFWERFGVAAVRPNNGSREDTDD